MERSSKDVISPRESSSGMGLSVPPVEKTNAPELTEYQRYAALYGPSVPSKKPLAPAPAEIFLVDKKLKFKEDPVSVKTKIMHDPPEMKWFGPIMKELIPSYTRKEEEKEHKRLAKEGKAVVRGSSLLPTFNDYPRTYEEARKLVSPTPVLLMGESLLDWNPSLELDRVYRVYIDYDGYLAEYMLSEDTDFSSCEPRRIVQRGMKWLVERIPIPPPPPPVIIPPPVVTSSKEEIDTISINLVPREYIISYSPVDLALLATCLRRFVSYMVYPRTPVVARSVTPVYIPHFSHPPWVLC